MKTIEVLGTGPTIEHYKPNDNETIGVNDIWKHHKVDNLLVLDLKSRFTPEQLHVIMNSTPKRFYSSLDEWYNVCCFDIRILLMAPPPGADLSYLDTAYLPIHVDSTYSAVCLAYRLKARRIIMHGVDLKDHPDLKLYWYTRVIQEAYKDLVKALKDREVDLFVGSKESPLSEFIPVCQ